MIWRIRERAAFARLAQHGRRTRAGVLWCRYLLDPTAHPPRVAFAIGRAYGPAVARNRLRRQLRAILADHPPPSGWYLIGVNRDTTSPIAGFSSDVETMVERLYVSSAASTG